MDFAHARRGGRLAWQPWRGLRHALKKRAGHSILSLDLVLEVFQFRLHSGEVVEIGGAAAIVGVRKGLHRSGEGGCFLTGLSCSHMAYADVG